MNPHDHDHAHVSDAGDAAPGYYEIMETAARELLIEKQLITAGEIRRMLEVMDTRNPALGAKVVARAWVDPEFRARLLANGRAACEELASAFSRIRSSSCSRTQTMFIILSFALSALVIREKSSDCRRIGTSSSRIGRGQSRSRGRFSPSSARQFPVMSRYMSATRQRWFAISFYRKDRRIQRISTKTSLRH